MSNLCPCGNPEEYENCCQVYHSGGGRALTAEALMRSRYSAYVKCELDYLLRTITLLERKSFDRKSAREWSQGVEWLGLEIVSAKGGENDTDGRVEFIARFRHDGVEHDHREVSKFKKLNGRWFFIEGKIINTEPNQAETSTPAVSRNSLCPCGSGKKYKKCCA